jgi:hypothetical protein
MKKLHINKEIIPHVKYRSLFQEGKKILHNQQTYWYASTSELLAFAI